MASVKQSINLCDSMYQRLRLLVRAVCILAERAVNVEAIDHLDFDSATPVPERDPQ